MVPQYTKDHLKSITFVPPEIKTTNGRKQEVDEVLPTAVVCVLHVVAVGAVGVAAGAVAGAPGVSVAAILVLAPSLRRRQAAVGQGGQGHPCPCAFTILGALR